MDNYFESDLENVLRWESIDQLSDLSSVYEDDNKPESSDAPHRPIKTVYALQRDYISLYGSHPQMEDRIYSTCGVCEQVFNPQAVTSHKEHCPGKGRPPSQHIKKKVKSKKKQQGPSVPPPPLFKVNNETKPPPASLHLPKEPAGPPVLSKFSDIPQVVRLAPDILPFHDSVASPKKPEPAVSTSLATPSSPPLPSPPEAPEEPTSSKHKKSKKITKALREYDPDLHCGVIEGQKGPCTRSITCSNHKIQQRKSVVGRSKNIHVLIAEKKAAKERDTRQRSPPQAPMEAKQPIEVVFPTVESDPVQEEDTTTETASDVTDFISASSSNITLLDTPENELHDEVESDDPNQLESGYCSVDTSITTKSPIFYFNPISPMFVVTPVQFIQKENTVFVEDAPPRVHSPPQNGYFLTMPEPTSAIKLYKSHPKPAILPTYGARKVGGAILGSRQSNLSAEFQRTAILESINTKTTSASPCKAASYSVPAPRSLLLKSKTINKINCKRASTEKINSSDSKQIKLAPDVNGFILHTDVSEVPNHCIQENINLLNMK